MSRIIQLSAENVKRLTAVSITPQGNVIIIGGANGQGKTSVLDSIAMAFGGADEIPAMPVRRGKEKAKIVATLDNGLVITRTFTKAGGTNVIVSAADGARYPSPQSMLDALTGKLMFDPLAFIRMDIKKQADALKKLVNLDFTALDAKRKNYYDERTLVGRDVDRVRLHAEGMPFFADAPAEPVSTADLVAELDKAKQHNTKKGELAKVATDVAEVYIDAVDGQASVKKVIADLEAKLSKARVELAEYDAVVPKHLAARDAADKAVTDFQPIDEAPITAKLSASAETNRQVQANLLRSDALTALKSKETNHADLTKKIDAIDADKTAQLGKAPFPIDGLSIDDDNGVTFNGIPFSQASGAEQLRVSVAMSAALNPKLKVMIVRDGSLLDVDSMKLLAELAEKHDVQVFIERVGKADACAIVIEDGTVAGSQQKDEPAPATTLETPALNLS